MHKRIYIAGIAVYVVLLWLAVVFYKERVLFVDHAYYLFEIVNLEGFAIFHYRFIAVFTEVLPVIGVWLQQPLQQLMLTYSANIILFHLLCYVACGLLLRDYKAALGLLLFHILFATHTFYFTISEMIQATVLLFPIIALLRYQRGAPDKLWPAVFIALLVPIVAFAHPLMVFPAAFVLVFLWVDKHEAISLKAVVATGALYIAVLIFKAIFFKEPYESGAMGNLRNFQRLFPNYIDLYSNKAFLANCLTQYYWIPLGSILIIAVYITSRQWKKLGLFVAAMFGYLLLINVSYPGPDVHEFYIENLYTPLGLFLAMPIVFDVLPVMRQRSRVLAYALLGIIAVTGLVRIYQTHEPYTARVQWERNYMIANEGMKILAHERHAPMDTLLMGWATPFEFWLLSTTERNRTASIMFSNNIEPMSWAAGKTYDFITPWAVYPYDSLDKRYFKFADSFAAYKLMP